MEHIGIDVHSNESQICLLTEQGEILEPRIRTRPRGSPRPPSPGADPDRGLDRKRMGGGAL